MDRALVWLVGWLRPWRGWAPFLLALTALLCLPAAVNQVTGMWRPVASLAGLEAVTTPLLVLTVLATLVALTLARTRISERAALILGALLGLGLAAIAIGRLLPPLSTVGDDLRYGVLWLRLWLRDLVVLPLPSHGSTGHLWAQTANLGNQLAWDLGSLLQGGSFWTTTLYRLLAAFVAWSVAFLATWWIYRRESALAGLVPSGALLTPVVIFYPEIAFYLLIYLFCTLWLVAVGQLWIHRERWERSETDYPDNLGLELVLAATPWILFVILLAVLVPTRGFGRVSRAFWDQVEQVVGPLDEGRGPGGTGRGALPRSHLLGGSPELGETIVFYVDTNDPPPPRPEEIEVGLPAADLPAAPARYWRSETLDAYTGQGWASSPAESRTVAAGQPLDREPSPGFELLQTFDPVAPNVPYLYAANAPLQVDQPVEAWWRGPGDLARLEKAAEGGAGRYTVVSRPPQPTVDALRAAPPDLPPDLAERYLSLPESVPERVLDLAQAVTVDAGTDYDKSRAIEVFLRTYTYTLDLPDPPANRDVVDYFLFDQQEGYCDYYASAMVVMARAVGVPARFATGYAQGTYDHDAGRWVVTEEDGHSWAEVYFEGIGWVEFEPTAGLPGLYRPAGGQVQPVPDVPPLPARSHPWWQQVPWGLLLLGAILLLGVALVAWIWLPGQRRDATAAGMVRDRHERLVRWGARLGQPLRDGQTPHEYGAALGEDLRSRGQDTRWSQVRRAAAEAPSAVKDLSESYTRVQYSPEPVGDREGWRIRDLWLRLRRQLWWLWLIARSRGGK